MANWKSWWRFRCIDCPDQVLDIAHREIEIRLRDKRNRIYAAPADMYFS